MRTLHIRLLIVSIFWALLYSGCQQTPPRGLKTTGAGYPRTKRMRVIDIYHGTKVRDPYRWLEKPDSPDTQAWVAKQNELTSAFLAEVPSRDQIRSRLTNLMNYPSYSVPSKHGGRYFFWKNDGLQNQFVLYTQETLEDQPRIVINPNSLSSDGTIAVTATAISKDGRLLAYTLSRSGSNQQEIRIRNIESAQDYNETLQWCQFSQIAWKHDGTGFFYNRLPNPGTVPTEYHNRYYWVYWHKLGTPQSQDELIYKDPNGTAFSPLITQDGKFIILQPLYRPAYTKNRIYYRPVEVDGPFVKLLDQADARYEFIGNVESVFYFHTDLDAQRGRIITIDTNSPARDNWRTIIPETDDVIDSVALVNNSLVVAYMHDVYHQMKIYTLNATFIAEIPLPALGTVASLSGAQYDTQMFFSFCSFLFPTTNYRYDFSTGELDILQKLEIDFDFSGYETKQVFLHSRDGTRIPMFITHRKDLPLDANNPTILYGYGGFNVNSMPFFSSSLLLWLQMGGVYAVANIRGGREYGEAWHQAGMLDKKQNVFDDFTAAAEWLIENKYTNPRKLAMHGGSNGGLLVAACMVQRPDLYGAVVCRVPVIDMLRYHKFTTAAGWAWEFGNAEASVEQFKYLYAYSPLHNIKSSIEYPPILVTSADTDDHVVPAHAKKFVATLQAKAAGANPILLRIETKAGHGRGKPMSKIIEEETDIFTFLFKMLAMQYDNAKKLP